MRRVIATAAMAAALVGSFAASAADAQRWRGGGGGWRGGYGRGWGGYHRGAGSGVAVAAGILGLGVGAAIASSNRGYYRGGYGPYGYAGYGGGYYGYGPGPAYYGPPPGYGYYGGCRTAWRWDGYYGDYVPVRACY